MFDLSFVKNEKDLEIIFENNLKFNLYILNTVNKTNKLNGMIKRTFLSMNKTLFATIYKNLIRSIWGNSASHSNKEHTTH